MAEQDKSFENFINGLSRATPQSRLIIAQQLKDAGYYKGKISDKFDIKLYNALIEASVGYKSTVAFGKKFGTPVPDPADYLLQSATEGIQGGTGDGPTTTTQTYVTSPSQTAKLLDTVAQDLLGRKLTKAEKNKYTKLVNAQQRKQPSVRTDGEGFSSTRGGVDEQQFITEQIGATAEAKTNRATDAYAIMMQELGGLR